ncbi:MAG: MCE family protein, partial [Mycobacterium sp.]
NASLEQLLVLLPPYFAQQQSYTPISDSTGNARGDFAVLVDDPPACTVGFLPQSAQRSPNDLSDIDTPDGLYCKLPQDSPIAVRGVRNDPCIRKPGKRAPTVEICDSDQPFVPLAMRQHATGPAPFDPSLIAQGIPIDSRAGLGDQLYAPVNGTPLPPGANPSGTPPNAAPPAGQPVPPLEVPLAQTSLPPPPDGNSLNGQPIPPAGPPLGGAPDGAGDVPPPAAPPPGSGDGSTAAPAAPSAFGATSPDAGPKVAFAQYNPRTGEYIGSDGNLYKVTNLVADAPLVKTWRDLLPH